MPPVLETERTFLRELLLNDVESLSAILDQYPRSEAYALPTTAGLRPWILRQHESYGAEGFGIWAIIERNAAVLVGIAGLTPRDFGERGTCELFCLIDPAARGRGLGREVASALREKAVRHPQIARLAMLVSPVEAPGLRLAENLAPNAERHELSIDDEAFLLFVERPRK